MISADKNNLDSRGKMHENAKILVVDSDSKSTRVVLETSARSGIHATVAADVKRAGDLIEKSNYDLIFVSAPIVAPCGLQQNLKLLDKIKANSPETPVVVIAETAGSDMVITLPGFETAG